MNEGLGALGAAAHGGASAAAIAAVGFVFRAFERGDSFEERVEQKVEKLLRVLVHEAAEALVGFFNGVDKALRRENAHLLGLALDLRTLSEVQAPSEVPAGFRGPCRSGVNCQGCLRPMDMLQSLAPVTGGCMAARFFSQIEVFSLTCAQNLGLCQDGTAKGQIVLATTHAGEFAS